MKNVYTAENPAEAHLVAGLLDEAGIECVVEGDLLTGARMALGMDASTLPTVFVRDEDAARATAMIAERHVPRASAPSGGETNGAEAGVTEERVPDSAGLVFFKRLLLALVVFTIASGFWMFVASGTDAARVGWLSGAGAQWAMLGVILAVSFGIGWLVVPGRRARR